MPEERRGENELDEGERSDRAIDECEEPEGTTRGRDRESTNLATL